MEQDVITWLEKVLHERDRRYEERFAAQEKAVAAAFKSSQLAIDKAEVALLDWKESHNELQRQLKDQQATNYSRKDVDGLLSSLSGNIDGRLNRLDDDVKGLRESRSEGTGMREQRREGRDQSDTATGLLIAVAGVALSTLVAAAALIVALVK